jgi:3-oxoacyl-[acyl-carrier-protein] synthase-3
LRINKEIEARMMSKGLRPNVVYNTISEVGNTTSAALPYGVTHAYETERLKPGMTALLAAFGGGYTWMVTPIRWTMTEPC